MYAILIKQMHNLQHNQNFDFLFEINETYFLLS